MTDYEVLILGAGLATPDRLPPTPPPRRQVAPERPLEPALRARFRDAVERSRTWQ